MAIHRPAGRFGRGAKWDPRRGDERIGTLERLFLSIYLSFLSYNSERRAGKRPSWQVGQREDSQAHVQELRASASEITGREGGGFGGSELRGLRRGRP